MAQPVPPHAARTGTIYRSTRSMPVESDSVLTVLLRGVADRDCEAFAKLYATLAPSLWSDVVAGGFSPADADAVLASTFLDLWQLARFEVDDDAQFVAWIRGSVGRRCAERRMRGSISGPPATGTDARWWHAAERNDRYAKQAIKELLEGGASADRQPAVCSPAARPPDGRLAPVASVAGPQAAGYDLPETRRPRRVDLGAASAFGHRRRGGAPAG
jgi:hypothetical protein